MDPVVRTVPERARPNARGAATRERIILVAERMMAESGLFGPTLEDIGVAAGQRNKTAVQYHFGDRDGLIDAIVEYRSASLRRIRAEMLAELDRRGAADVRSLVEALVLPLAQQIRADGHYATFQAQLTLARGPFNRTPSFSELRERLGHCLPDIPAALLDSRWGYAIDMRMVTLAHIEQSVRAATLGRPIADAVSDFITFLVGGLAAPAHPPDGRDPLAL